MECLTLKASEMEFEFRIFWKVSVLTSILVYLLMAFVKWDFFWIKEVANYTINARFFIVILWGCKTVMDGLISTFDDVKEVLTPAPKQN
jgi:hypothetical protein